MVDAEKYQRLAEEFQKIKQHNAILKKAFRDEQEKTAKLDAELKAAESRLRTEALEEEKAKASSSSGWFGSGAKAELARAQQQLQIVKEELEVKIRENEELHMRIFETGQETGTIKEDLQDRISRLKADVRSKTDELDDVSHQTKHTITRLTSENASLHSRAEELSDTLVRTKSLMQQREHTMTIVQQQLSSDLSAATSTIDSKLPFNDTSDAGLNRLNLPAHDFANAVSRSSVSNSAITLFKKFIGFWKEWCDLEHEKMLYMNRSSSDTSEAQRQINRKLGTYLAEFQHVLASLVSSYASYMTSESFSADSDAVKLDLLMQLDNFVGLHERTALAFKSRSEGESSSLKFFTDNEAARKYNSSLADNWTQSHTQLESLASHFRIFLGATTLPSSTSASTLNALFSLQRVFNHLEALKVLIKERVTTMQQLFNLEKEVDSFLPNDVKVINSHRIGALGNASAMLDKICDLAKEFLLLLPGKPAYAVRSAHCEYPDGLFPLERLSSRSRQYMASLRGHTDDHTSVPYADQLKHLALVSELSVTVRSKDIDIAALKQQLMQHASVADKVTQELRTCREALALSQSSLSEVRAEVERLKLAVPTIPTPSFGFDRTLVTQSTNTNQLEPPPYQDLPHSTSTTEAPPTYANFLSNQVLEDPANTSLPHESTAPTESALPAFAVADLLVEYQASAVLPSLAPALPSSADTVPANRTMHSSSSVPTASQKPWNMSVVGDEPLPTTSLELGDPDRDREESVRRYYEQRSQQLQAKVEAVDKKNIELFQQAAELEKRLKDSVAQRESVKAELDATHLRLVTGSEELETTRANYDQQLKTLTEHMVALSDKIGVYEEQLSVLKNSTVRCGKCKAWNTIEWLIGEGKMGQRCSHGNHPSSFNYA